MVRVGVGVRVRARVRDPTDATLQLASDDGVTAWHEA